MTTPARTSWEMHHVCWQEPADTLCVTSGVIMMCYDPENKERQSDLFWFLKIKKWTLSDLHLH